MGRISRLSRKVRFKLCDLRVCQHIFFKVTALLTKRKRFGTKIPKKETSEKKMNKRQECFYLKTFASVASTCRPVYLTHSIHGNGIFTYMNG